jgi:hypothetical protein
MEFAEVIQTRYSVQLSSDNGTAPSISRPTRAGDLPDGVVPAGQYGSPPRPPPTPATPSAGSHDPRFAPGSIRQGRTAAQRQR